jgi:hypothetical protein
MLGEAFDFLISESYKTKPILRKIAIGVERIAPGYGKFVAPVYLGYKGGTTFGKIAGEDTGKRLARGGFVVGLERTPEIEAYEVSALGSTRII